VIKKFNFRRNLRCSQFIASLAMPTYSFMLYILALETKSECNRKEHELDQSEDDDQGENDNQDDNNKDDQEGGGKDKNGNKSDKEDNKQDEENEPPLKKRKKQ